MKILLLLLLLLAITAFAQSPHGHITITPTTDILTRVCNHMIELVPR